MTVKHRLYMVDVFAEQAYSGNPLAVIVSTETLSGNTMQKVAAEMNFSETTFVQSDQEHDGGYRVRIYTPSQEIEFAGHPILGTAWVIRQHLMAKQYEQVLLNLIVGQVPVTFESAKGKAEEKEVTWFRAPPMSLGKTSTRLALAPALGLSTEDIKTNPPIQMVSAGTSAIIVPIRSMDALRRSKLDLAAFSPLTADGYPPLIYLFCDQTHHSKNDLCVRFFFDAHGVREDPATGNGAAFLGAYLFEHQTHVEDSFFIRIEQGYEIHRPSLILLQGRKVNGVREVRVGGYVIQTIQGELL